VFIVQASNDAHIGLFSSTQTTDEVYEIVIGGWGNTRSVIRKQSSGTNQVEANTPNILSSIESRQFWVDAVGGLVRVGSGGVIGSNIIMQWQDSAPHVATHVGVRTGWGATGQWHVCNAGSIGDPI
jgi:hypothetical protein